MLLDYFGQQTHFQAIAKRDVCTKFYENQSTVAISRAHVGLQCIRLEKTLETYSGDQDRCMFNGLEYLNL